MENPVTEVFSPSMDSESAEGVMLKEGTGG